jgi:hypothetical protein
VHHAGGLLDIVDFGDDVPSWGVSRCAPWTGRGARIAPSLWICCDILNGVCRLVTDCSPMSPVQGVAETPHTSAQISEEICQTDAA